MKLSESRQGPGAKGSGKVSRARSAGSSSVASPFSVTPAAPRMDTCWIWSSAAFRTISVTGSWTVTVTISSPAKVKRSRSGSSRIS